MAKAETQSITAQVKIGDEVSVTLSSVSGSEVSGGTGREGGARTGIRSGAGMDSGGCEGG